MDSGPISQTKLKFAYQRSFDFIAQSALLHPTAPTVTLAPFCVFSQCSKFKIVVYSGRESFLTEGIQFHMHT